MRLILIAVLCSIIGASVVFASTPAPTNLTVTAKRDSTGQYFHVTFRKITVPTDSSASSYYYRIYRWNGVDPNTTKMTNVGYTYQSSDTTGTYDDHSTAFLVSPADSNFCATYSYSVVTVHRISDTTGGVKYDTSEWSTKVSGTLDTFYLKFTSAPSMSNNVHVGDTVRGTFVATENRSGAVITYRITSNSGPAIGGIDSVTGVFWATQTTAQSSSSNTRFAINAYDEQGRTVQTRLYLSVAIAPDSIVVMLVDGSGNPLPSYTRCYWGIGSPSGQDSVLATNTVRCNSGGWFTIVEVHGARRIRVSAEGFLGRWIGNSPNGDTISSSGPYSVTLTAAASHTISGKATTVGDTALSGVVINAYRIYGTGKAYTPIDTVKTDSNGQYSVSVPIGDTLLGTLNVYMLGMAHGFTDSTKWYSNSATTTRTTLSITADYDTINFSFLKRSPAPPPPTYNGYVLTQLFGSSSSDTLRIRSKLEIYRFIDSGTANQRFTLYRTDTTTNGHFASYVPYGKYLLLATPTDTGYMSGYFKLNAYAVTAAEADTFSVGTRYNYVNIMLKKDSSSAHAGSGSPIDGVVRDSSGPVSGAHLLLYQILGAPAGTASGKILEQTTMTDATGHYAFSKVPTGLYEIYVDLVGRPAVNVGGINVDTSGNAVKKDISLGASGIAGGNVLPGGLSLSQNYPNPFSSSTTLAFTTGEIRTLVDVSIYDITGRCVANVLHGNIAQGQHQVDLRQQLQPGVYTCVLKSGAVVASRRMTVVK